MINEIKADMIEKSNIIMKILKKIIDNLSFKCLIKIKIKCSIIFEGEIVEFYMYCKLLQNKNNDRKINLSIDDYPICNISDKNKELIHNFLNNIQDNRIPSYNYIKLPIIIEDNSVL